MTTMTKTHRLKFILPLAAVAMFASASVSNADSVVYDLTMDTPVGFGGTVTLDLSFAPTSTDGTIDTYEWGNSAIVAFSIFQPSTAEVLYEPSDGPFLFTLTMSTADDTPLTLSMDVDDSVSGFLFGAVEFIGQTITAAPGTGNIDTMDPNGTVTGAALTAGATSSPPFAITEFDYAPGDNMVTLTWNSREGEKYAVKFSKDMTSWGGDLDDDVDADAGDTTTKSFDLTTAGLAGAGRVYFRVERL
jgi:hypothetical protein